jgi:nitroimidazol reductase NimA-like FMN-containing flavoprotein (pyridoxamine 5'-phosphate oxidase superfamily)
MRWRKDEKEFVAVARTARVATVDGRGVPHNVPVCPLLDGDTVCFATEKGAKKLRNIETNPQVAVVVDEYVERWDHLRGVMIQGTGRIVGRAEFRRLRAKLYAKFQQYPSQAAIGDSDSVIVRVTPEKKFSWGFE